MFYNNYIKIFKKYFYKMVRSRRLELPRVLPHNDLNVTRIPIPPRTHFIKFKLIHQRFDAI